MTAKELAAILTKLGDRPVVVKFWVDDNTLQLLTIRGANSSSDRAYIELGTELKP
jgi:hypothetical protein